LSYYPDPSTCPTFPTGPPYITISLPLPLVIPATSSLTKPQLHEHDSVIGGHGGYKKTLTRLTTQFY